MPRLAIGCRRGGPSWAVCAQGGVRGPLPAPDEVEHPTALGVSCQVERRCVWALPSDHVLRPWANLPGKGLSGFAVLPRFSGSEPEAAGGGGERQVQGSVTDGCVVLELWARLP